MEKQQLPNATLILIFGILSIITCCCYGVIGLILGIVALVLANKATAVYAANPELYTGFQNVKTGKILHNRYCAQCDLPCLCYLGILNHRL